MAVVVLSALYGPMVWRDSGPFDLALFGVPLACAVTALWAEKGSRTMLAPAVVAVLAAVSLGWSLVTALGVGLGFAVPALLLLLAAMASRADRQQSSETLTN